MRGLNHGFDQSEPVHSSILIISLKYEFEVPTYLKFE